MLLRAVSPMQMSFASSRAHHSRRLSSTMMEPYWLRAIMLKVAMLVRWMGPRSRCCQDKALWSSVRPVRALTTVLVNGQVQVSHLTQYLKSWPQCDWFAVCGRRPDWNERPVGIGLGERQRWVSLAPAIRPKRLSSASSRGTSFGPSIFHHDGSILSPAGWYDANGVLNDSFPLQPGKAYIFFDDAMGNSVLASGRPLIRSAVARYREGQVPPCPWNSSRRPRTKIRRKGNQGLPKAGLGIGTRLLRPFGALIRTRWNLSLPQS